jgi:hypothetical protein
LTICFSAGLISVLDLRMGMVLSWWKASEYPIVRLETQGSERIITGQA